MVLSSKGACHLFKRSSRLSEDGDKCAPKHFPVSFICIALGLSGVFTLLSLEFSVPLSFSSSVCKATSATCDRNFSPCSSFLFLSSFLSWIFFFLCVCIDKLRREKFLKHALCLPRRQSPFVARFFFVGKCCVTTSIISSLACERFFCALGVGVFMCLCGTYWMRYLAYECKRIRTAHPLSIFFSTSWSRRLASTLVPVSSFLLVFRS